ncbi:MAG: hypothetical protein ACK4MI_03625 [Brevundimonas sp.]|uniref:hypothetical protein n=1 Tax=Brevundimonas sp. TaxID=1871086 RepID=UPI00391BA944
MAEHRICSVEGCCNRVHGAGLCNTHYKRLKKHGDTETRQRAATGERRIWLEAHVGYEGDDCLPWPYSRYHTGYGQFTISEGVNGTASRVMCELAHGAPPTLSHEAAHSCGNGHEGCVNPRHLRWATQSQNAADKVRHGTDARGEKQWMSKLTEADVRRIRSLNGKKSQAALAREYDVHPTTISDVMTGRRWGWLT